METYRRPFKGEVMVTNSKPTIENITDSAIDAVRQYISKELETVVSVEAAEGGWAVVVEVLERRAVPDTQDLLGRYEVKLNKQGKMLGWRQKMVRKRSDRLIPADEEWVVAG